MLDIPRSEVEAALLALEAEGFVLRGKFHPHATEQEWCDRRLLARIHRLTIDRLRAEIQPVSHRIFIAFSSPGSAWMRNIASEGPEGLQSVLEQLDGCELPLAAWESAVLSARIADYDPEWLDRLCFSGRIGWGRLSAPQNPKARARSLRCEPVPSRFISAKTSRIGCVLAQANRRWNFRAPPNCVRTLAAWRGAFLHRTRAIAPGCCLSSRRSIVRTCRAWSGHF